MPPVLVTFTTLRELAPAELGLMAPAERRHLIDIGSHRRRQEYSCGRALLRHTLERWTGDPAQSHRLATTELGKPHCIDGPAVSISHSGDLVTCAMTACGDIGVDLELPDRRRRTADIAHGYFSGEEARWLKTQPADRFYMLWVLKEAYLKLIGRGLSGLNGLRCKVLPPKIEASIRNDSIEGLGLYAMGEAFLALASRWTSLQEVRFERWDPTAANPVRIAFHDS
jgi:phosphopantetheinyl transferase